MSRTQIQIALGIIAVLVMTVIVFVYGLQEEERMETFESGHRAAAIEVGAELFDTYCSRCHGKQGLGIQGLCPPLNDRNFFDNRMDEVGWNGSMEDYIASTVSGGRISSTRPQLYPGQGVPSMPSFGEQSGGPLREDQVRAIAAFIVNWEETATLVTVPTPPAGPTVGTDITKALPEGDVQSGEALTVSLGCTACHLAGESGAGPDWLASDEQPGIGERAALRIEQDGYSGAATTPEEYLFESIVLPADYLVSGYENLMPGNYGSTLTDQDMADMIAYLLSVR